MDKRQVLDPHGLVATAYRLEVQEAPPTNCPFCYTSPYREKRITQVIDLNTWEVLKVNACQCHRIRFERFVKRL